MNGWMVQQLMEERNRELATAQRAHRATPREVRADRRLPVPAEANPRLYAVPTVKHRPAGQVIGEWLIRTGVKLGGTSIRTS